MADVQAFPKAPSSKTWTQQDWDKARVLTQILFEPMSPIDQNDLFSGRIEQVSKLLDVVYDKGAHAIIYGERGVDKSSLANVIRDKVPPVIANYKFIKDNCRPEDTFFDLWSKMLFGFEYEGTPISDLLANEKRHFIVQKMLESLNKSHQYIFIFDEFDRISSPETKSAMADTVKHFSDYPQNVTIVIVGVGFSITELFGAHPSIERCCKQIYMPRVSSEEIRRIITERAPKIGIKLHGKIVAQLVGLAQGFPGFGHLLGREAILSAIGRRSREVEEVDVTATVNEGVDKAQESMRRLYQTATYSAKGYMYPQVLLACALANKNDMGLFSASDVKEKLMEISEKKLEIGHFARHLTAFCDTGRGPVLRKTGKPKRYQYQFIDAPFQPYITMVGRRDKLI